MATPKGRNPKVFEVKNFWEKKKNLPQINLKQ